MWVPYKLRLWAFLLRERLNKGKYPRLMIADDLPEDHKFPFENGERVLVLGELHNMRGHVVFVTRHGQVGYGIHEYNFREPTDDEL